MAMIDMKQIEALEDATDLLQDPETLRRQAQENGYLFFRNLLDPERVIEVRHQILSICRDHGWLMDGSEVTEGIANPDIQVVESKDPRWQAFYDDVLKIRDFHALALEPPLIRAFEVLFGEQVLPHSRNICRLVFPDTDTHSTPPHQDNYFIGGSDETWTAWIPCGDCPRRTRWTCRRPRITSTRETGNIRRRGTGWSSGSRRRGFRLDRRRLSMRRRNYSTQFDDSSGAR